MIHGTGDSTVPFNGGQATGRGSFLIRGVSFPSVDQTAALLRAGGASVQIIPVNGADHGADKVDAVIRQAMGTTIGAMLTNFIRGG